MSSPHPHVPLRRWKAEAVLVLVALFWGWTFAIVKDATELVPVQWFLALRFALSAALLAIMIPVERLSPAIEYRSATGPGILLGAFLYLGYAFQTEALAVPAFTATESAFLTGTTAIWTPFVAWTLTRRRIGATTWIAAAIGLGGLFLLAGGADGLATTSGGDVWPARGLTIGCAICFSAQIALTRRYTLNRSTARLATAQLATVAALSAGAAWATGEPIGWRYPVEAYGAIAFCALFATVFAFWAQTRMQRHTTEERTALVFLFEPVFAALAGFALRGERLGAAQWAGAILIAAASIGPEAAAVARRRFPGRRG